MGGAFVDVVYKPDQTGGGMEESTFRGPIDLRITNTLRMIESVFVRAKTYKTDRPEAMRIYNYPIKAIRELLVNAVYHKSYEIGEPVMITITPTTIEFLNYPGPSRLLSDEDIQNNNLSVGTYRNSRVGEYLKKLKLAESRFTGIPSVVKSLESNGSPPLKIQTDPERSYFKAILRIHPDFINENRNKTDTEILSETRILNAIKDHGCMNMTDLSTSLGYNDVSKKVRDATLKLMSDWVLEYLCHDKPRSPKQRIRLKNRR